MVLFGLLFHLPDGQKAIMLGKIFGLPITLVLINFVLVFGQKASTFECYYTENKIAEKLCAELREFSLKDNTEANDILKKILSPVGLRPNFVLQPCDNIQNCVATIGDDGLRYIIYDRAFMNKLGRSSDWASLSIFAHEVLHHLNQHTHIKASLEKRRELELEADEWSGRILAKLGATLKDAQSAMELLQHPEDETFSSHPTKERRLDAIARGHQQGLGTPVKPKNDLQPVDYSLQFHDFVKMKDLSRLQARMDSGLLLTQIITLKDDWYCFFIADSNYWYKQYITTAKTSTQLKDLILKAKNWQVETIEFSNDQWIVLSKDKMENSNTQILTNNTLDLNDLNLKKALGTVVQDIAFGENTWIITMQDASAIQCIDQLILTTKVFPFEEISALRTQKFIATTSRYLNSQWVTVLQKFDTNASIQIQAKVRKSTLQIDELLKFESQGFRLKSVGYDGKNWSFIMNRTK